MRDDAWDGDRCMFSNVRESCHLAEGTLNKLYAISTSGDNVVESQLSYVFRVTIPVEPFYKTASKEGDVEMMLGRDLEVTSGK